MRPEQQYIDQAALMNDTVWRVCSQHLVQSARPRECCECAHAEVMDGEIVHRACRMLAEETVAMVLEAAALTSAAGSTPEPP